MRGAAGWCGGGAAGDFATLQGNSIAGTGMPRIVLHVEGMSCGHCLNAVSRALAGSPGVTVESVRMGRAEVDYDERVTSPGAVAAAVADAGYRATIQPA